jgi:DNA-binding NarL/FixJ family response regulator
MTESIRVFVVDDHTVVRQGVGAFISELDGIEVIGEAARGEDAVRKVAMLAAEGARPAVVLMDLMMPGMDGITATKELKKRHPEVEVVIMTSFGEVERVRTALEAGASGYLLKDAAPDELEKALRVALSGELHLDSAVARQLTASMLGGNRPSESLSPREREVLGLVGRGFSNREIAEELVISERTARTHVSNILLKLELSSRTKAALWAIENGIVPPA